MDILGIFLGLSLFITIVSNIIEARREMQEQEDNEKFMARVNTKIPEQYLKTTTIRKEEE